MLLAGPGLAGGDGYRLEVLLTPRREHLALAAHDDVAGGADPVEQVLRHGLGERGPADHQDDLPGVPGDVQRGLAGRVGRPDDVDVIAGALAGLRGVGAVVDATA